MGVEQLQIQRRLTTAFIATQPVTIVLKPRNKVRTSSGGFTWQNAVARPPQVMKLIQPTTQLQEMPFPVQAQDGQVREIIFMIIAEWDAVIGQFDVFELDGFQYEVIQVGLSNGWEQRASVARYG